MNCAQIAESESTTTNLFRIASQSNLTLSDSTNLIAYMSVWLRRLIPFVLGVGLLLYALSGISFAEVFAQFRALNGLLLIPLTSLIILHIAIRAARWRLILRPLGYNPTSFRLAVAFQSAHIGSMILPGGGELARCLTLQRTDNIPLSQSLGLVVAERIIDLVAMAILFALVAALEFKRVVTYLNSLPFAFSAYTLSIFVSITIFFIIAVLWLYRQFKSQIQTMSNRWSIRFRSVLEGLWEGFTAIRKLSRPGLFLVYTLMLQLLAWGINYLLLTSISATHSLPPTAALTILAVAALGGLAIPTQGGIGTYHFLVSRALVLYGLTTAQGALVATLMHAVQFGINIALSGLSFLIIPVLVERAQEKQRANHAQMP